MRAAHILTCRKLTHSSATRLSSKRSTMLGRCELSAARSHSRCRTCSAQSHQRRDMTTSLDDDHDIDAQQRLRQRQAPDRTTQRLSPHTSTEANSLASVLRRELNNIIFFLKKSNKITCHHYRQSSTSLRCCQRTTSLSHCHSTTMTSMTTMFSYQLLLLR